MSQEKKPTMVHLKGANTDVFVVPQNIALIQTLPNGSAAIACSGGGVFQLDGLQWRLVQEQLKTAFDLQVVYMAPAAGGVI